MTPLVNVHIERGNGCLAIQLHYDARLMYPHRHGWDVTTVITVRHGAEKLISENSLPTGSLW
jgi:hypothetical protein